ncbi:ribokinase [Methanobacterium movens]
MSGFLILGPLSNDTIIKDGLKTHSVGGAVYYQSRVFSSLNLNHTVVVTLAADDQHLLNEFPEKTRLIPVFKKETVRFENKYFNNDPNKRIQRSNAPNIPLTTEDLLKIFKSEEMDFEGIILSPLLSSDIPLSTVKWLSKKDIPLYAGAQGYLRNLKNCDINLNLRPEFEELLKMVGILFLDENELKAIKINRKETFMESLNRLASYGPEEIVITCGDKGSLIYSQEKVHKIKAYPPLQVGDPTGLGDTYLAAYLSCKKNNKDPIKCGKFAAQIATKKLESRI